MAKDGTARGGARVGAGRRPKALADKIALGRPAEVLSLPDPSEMKGADVPPVKEYMKASQKSGIDLCAEDVFKSTYLWLKERGCERYVNTQLIEQYAMSVSRWVQCETCISEYGFLAKHPTTGAAITSPYVTMSQNYLKQVNQCWYQIYQIVKENCSVEYGGASPHDDLMPLVEQAIRIDATSRDRLTAAMKGLTELDNPNSVAQMKGWLAENGVEAETLGKKAVAAMIKETEGDVSKALSLRLQLAKSSVKKYQAMENAACSDGRVRGMFKFYGANRTGRYSSTLIQLQNLARNEMADLAGARALVRDGNTEALDLLYDSIPEVLSQLVRTALIPAEGKKFYVADFSAIEARVIAWLAGEEWRNRLFAEGGDIYCMSASQMFGVPVEKHGINHELRAKGKVAELACLSIDSPVITDHGLVPIQDVTTDMKVWDGEEWVSHEGVIYKGKREVITYDGLTATTDHLVFVEGEQSPVRFGLASARGYKLIQTSDGERAIRLSENHQRAVCGIRETEEPIQHKCTARLYDVRNAGLHHRFTVSGKLVHNCGYGGSVGALVSMGALDMGLKEEELKPLVSAWRQSNPNIVRLWWDVDRAVKAVVREHSVQVVKGIRFFWRSGMLFITLPSGRSLAYVKPRMGMNRFGGESVTYEGIGGTKKWERIESYGPKFVENIVQATSRDILMYAMKTLRCCSIVAHCHDELIIEADPRGSLDAVCEQMGRTPPWAEGLILRADGYVCDYYKKD